MTNTTSVRSAGMVGGDRHEGILPIPRRGARWRWSAPHRLPTAGGQTPRAPGPRTMVNGRVAAVQGDAFVVQDLVGTTKIVETRSTGYTTLGRGHPSTGSRAPAVHTGDFVGISGVAGEDGTVTATSVTVFSLPPFKGSMTLLPPP